MTIDQERAKIEAELAKLTEHIQRRSKRIAKLREEERSDFAKSRKLEDKLHALTIKALIGRPGAVRIKYRRPAGHRESHLNDAPGTVKGVRRTRATVVFDVPGRGDEQWSFPLEYLCPATEKQGADMGAVLMPAFD